jgi:hypothetical protein
MRKTNRLNNFIKDNANLETATKMAERYQISGQRMIGIIQHTENDFPRAEKISPCGRIWMWDHHVVDSWLAGRDIKIIPWIKNASFTRRCTANESKTKLMKPRNQFSPPDDHGAGGLAIGHHLQMALVFYCLLTASRNPKKLREMLKNYEFK